MKNNLNMIFSGFLYPFNYPIIEKIKIEFSVNNIIHIGDHKIYPSDYSRDELKFGNYYDNIDFSEIPPLNESILNDFKYCEHLSVKMMDRINHKLSETERLNLYYKNLRYWLWKIKSKNISFFISDNIPHEVFDYIIYCICKYLNIKTIMFHELPSRPMRHIMIHLTECINEIGKDIRDEYKQILLNPKIIESYSLNKEIENFREDMSKSSNEIEQFTQQVKKESASKEIIKYFLNNYKSFKNNLTRTFNSKSGSNLPNLIRFNFIKSFMQKIFSFITRTINYIFELLKLRKSLQIYYQSICDPNPNLEKKYIYFPLHYQPELSTSPLAERFVNQELIVDMISNEMPSDCFLYIKEHPRISYNRSRRFYNRILSYHNVKLLNEEINSYSLIDKSIAVATATGSVGWEAFHRNKPVLMFGRRFYQFAPGIYKIQKSSDLLSFFQNIKELSEISENKKEYYLHALSKFAFRGFNTLTKKKISDISDSENIDNHVFHLINKIRSIIKESSINEK